MTPSPTSSISCRMIAEFDDDASTFAAAEPEFVPPPTRRPLPGSSPEVEAASAFSPPSPVAAAAAKKFWLKVLRRFTEPVPGKKGHLRIPSAGEPDEGRILIECGPPVGRGRTGAESRTWAGDEVDVADKDYLALFGRRFVDPRAGDPGGHLRIAESLTPLLWTTITNIRFEIERVVKTRASTGS